MLFSKLENDTFGLNQAELINEIKTPAQLFLESGSVMTRATFVIVCTKTKLSSFID
jgi:hypothetical protein